jgi:hypothetical protein
MRRFDPDDDGAARRDEAARRRMMRGVMLGAMPAGTPPEAAVVTRILLGTRAFSTVEISEDLDWVLERLRERTPCCGF